MYQVLGWVNIAAVMILLLPFSLNFYSKKEKGVINSFGRFLRKFHKILGIVMLISVIVHGLLALGSITLHTGTIVGVAYIITGVFGVLFVILKKKEMFTIHRYFAVAFVLLIVIHLLLPSLLS